MAVDKLVDSTQLDADLTSVANAIRAKGGTSAQLAFPAGFISAVEAIPTGEGGLPAEYQEVDYIETDGNSRIDTGVSFDGSKDFVLKAVAMKSSDDDSNQSTMGWNAGGTIGFAYNREYYWYDGSATLSAESNLEATAEATQIEMTIQAGTSTNTISKYTNSTGTRTLTRTHPNVHNRTFLDFPLFAASAQSNYSYTPAGFRIRSAVIIQGGVTLRDLVACYRISDGVIGFYDRANSVFYTNQGTGTFSKGFDLLSAEQALNVLLGV